MNNYLSKVLPSRKRCEQLEVRSPSRSHDAPLPMSYSASCGWTTGEMGQRWTIIVIVGACATLAANRACVAENHTMPGKEWGNKHKAARTIHRLDAETRREPYIGRKRKEGIKQNPLSRRCGLGS